MAEKLLYQHCAWPGVKAIASVDYVCSHGITPGRCVLTTYPQTGLLGTRGDLAIGDGTRAIVIRDCRVERMTASAGSEGQTWTLEIADRRWRWPGRNGISGRYNVLDTRGKLVPWTIRSPVELATLCLEEMGERGYSIDLPRGIPKAAGANVERYLKLGENFPQSLTNPLVEWDHTPPMEALARLVEQYGRVIVYDPVTDRVIVTPLGAGQDLPEVPCEAIGPSFENPRIPYKIGVYGSPVRVQMRFALEPVGKEWDGTVLPIEQLSYAPRVPPDVQISTVVFSGVGSPVPSFTIEITINPGAMNATLYQFTAGTGEANVTDAMTKLKNAINAHPVVSPIVIATSGAQSVGLTGQNIGVAFGVRATSNVAVGDSWVAQLVQSPAPKNGRTWMWSHPNAEGGGFINVEATDRLSVQEARNLARESVFKWYRLIFIDPHTGKPPIAPPWYKGKIVRRQQIILQQTRVEQLTPQARVPGGINRGNPVIGAINVDKGIIGADALGILPDFYDGFSRDLPAIVTGSHDKWLPGLQVLWAPQVPGGAQVPINSPASARVYASFSVDAFEQTVKFDDPVYQRFDGGQAGFVVPSALTLETACLIADAVTNQVVRWEVTQVIGGDGGIEWERHDDIQVGVIQLYYGGKIDGGPGNVGMTTSLSSQGTGDWGDIFTASSSSSGGGDAAQGGPPNNNPAEWNKKNGWKFADGDIQDMQGRSSYYLAGMLRKYQLSAGKTQQEIGIRPKLMTGALQQMGFSLGPGGATTRASVNSEYSTTIPPAPVRRRAENLPANRSAALANMLERSLSPIPPPNALVAPKKV